MLEHNLTHWPFRSWCQECVEGRGKERVHKSLDRSGDSVPTVDMDFLFLTEKDSTEQLVVLVIKDTASGAIGATAVLDKTAAEFTVKFVAGILERWGYPRVILRTDGEPAIVKLAEAVRLTRNVNDLETVLRTGPRYSSASMGSLERANQEIASLVRTAKLAFERRFQVKLGVQSPLLPWIVRHAGWVYTRFAIKEDGLTPYKRLFGRGYGGTLCELGESVYAKLPEKQGKWIRDGSRAFGSARMRSQTRT